MRKSEKVIIPFYVLITFILLCPISGTFAGVSEIKKQIDNQNTENKPLSQPAPVNSTDQTDKWNTVVMKAESGDADAMVRLGCCYDLGDSLTKMAKSYPGSIQCPLNKRKAFDLFTGAAEKGNTVAQYLLGTKYDSGEDVPQDKHKAALWYAKAARQDFSTAQYLLGKMYINGEGVQQDKKKGVELLNKAAEKGEAEAQLELGNMYLRGDIVPLNPEKAVELISLAAEEIRYCSKAQLQLAGMYLKGEGVKMNKIESYKRYLNLAKWGNEDAQRNLDILCKESPWACK